MITYYEVDIKVSASGDLTVAPNADFEMADPSGVLKQDITFRIKTDFNDFTPHPDLGASLSDIIGEPNTRKTASIGEDKILHCLTFDGRISPDDLVIKAVPIALDSIVYYLFVRTGTTVLNVTPDYTFNINRGLVSYT